MRQGQNIKPRFEVEKINTMVFETRVTRVEGRNVEETVEVPYGYAVYFPAGHSIRVRDHAELQRLGFDHPAELIDADTGDVVGTNEPMSLKRQVQRRAGASGRRADSGAVDANQGG